MQAFSSNAAGRVFLRLRGDWRVLKVFPEVRRVLLGVWSLSNARAEGLGMGIRSQARFIFYPYCSFHSRLFLTKVYTKSKYTGIAVKKNEQTVRQYQEDARRLN